MNWGFFFLYKFWESIWFLEESFAALIGIIFIYEAFDKMIDINHIRPVRLRTNARLPSNCTCITSNGTLYGNSTINVN